MNGFLEFISNFKTQLLGSIFISSYLAWFCLSILGQVLATLIRNQIPNLKSYPVNAVQLITGLLVAFVFIRFSFELTGLIPTGFGAFIIGLGGNELALAALRKYLNKKKEETEIFADDIGGGGIKNPPPKPPTEP